MDEMQNENWKANARPPQTRTLGALANRFTKAIKQVISVAGKAMMSIADRGPSGIDGPAGGAGDTRDAIGAVTGGEEGRVNSHRVTLAKERSPNPGDREEVLVEIREACTRASVALATAQSSYQRAVEEFGDSDRTVMRIKVHVEAARASQRAALDEYEKEVRKPGTGCPKVAGGHAETAAEQAALCGKQAT
jgi:hypothetical protein